MLAIVLILLLAATPVPQPTATNPFTLQPIQGTPPPLIGTTRSRPLCSALRTVVSPAIQAAMTTDRLYSVLRGRIFDYVVKDSDSARDLHLMQMDHQVDLMVKQIDALETALKDPLLAPTNASGPEDQKSLKDLKTTLTGILAAQKTEESVMSGFVETERGRRFAQPDESTQAMLNAIQPAQTAGSYPTNPPISGYLNDQQATNVAISQHQVAASLHDAHKLDDDLGDIQNYTSRWEAAATKAIIPAAGRCK
ncbi:MAG: hypothetical protein ABSD03_14780 [Vulcanimicrobiaceae bacterium]